MVDKLVFERAYKLSGLGDSACKKMLTVYLEQDDEFVGARGPVTSEYASEKVIEGVCITTLFLFISFSTYKEGGPLVVEFSSFTNDWCVRGKRTNLSCVLEVDGREIKPLPLN